METRWSRIDNVVTGSIANVASLADRPGFTFVRRDIVGGVEVPGPVDAVMNLASPASPRDFTAIPVEIMQAGSAGTKHLLDLARAKDARFFLASTSEVYGDPAVHPQPETYWGNVNPIGPRAVYDEAKRYAEALTMAYHRRFGVDVRIARIFNTYGPYMRPDDGRVVSNFICQALAGEPLTVYGDGSQTRSFTYASDEVAGFVALLDSAHVGPVNLGNPEEFTIIELARLVLRRDRIVVGGGLRTASPGRPCPAPPRHHAGPDQSRMAAACAAGGGHRGHGRVVRPSRRGGHVTPRYQLLSVVVPVYNERNTVGEVIRRMRQVDVAIDREIIVVDDGSVDGTDKVLGALADSTVKVVTHAVNLGKGAAVRTGVGAARGDLVLIQDADLEYDPREWPRLLAPLLEGRTRVVYGSRYIGEREVVSLGRWATDRALSLLAAVLFNSTISDIETGYKVIDRAVFDRLHLQAERFDFEPEITAKLLGTGERIFEVPVTYAGRGEREGRKFTRRDNLLAAWTLIRLRFGRGHEAGGSRGQEAAT